MNNPWSPFYWADYIADTGHLTLAQHGAYLLLMAHYYGRRRPIPANASVSHRICRCTTDAERIATDEILREFFVLDGDVYRHKRIERELAKAIDISGKRSAAAKAKHNKSRADAGANAFANAGANAEQMHTQPQPQSHIKPKSRSLARLSLAESDLEQIYKLYPRRTGKGAALKAIRKAIERLMHGEYGNRNFTYAEAVAGLKDRTDLYARSPAGNQGKFTPHPATWFNRSDYLDDKAEWSKTDGDRQVSKAVQRAIRNKAAILEGLGPGGDADGALPVLRSGTNAGGDAEVGPDVSEDERGGSPLGIQ